MTPFPPNSPVPPVFIKTPEENPVILIKHYRIDYMVDSAPIADSWSLAYCGCITKRDEAIKLCKEFQKTGTSFRVVEIIETVIYPEETND